jgi:TolB-like protein/DNA-binding winged helix-turn-helix (wHTH) protein
MGTTSSGPRIIRFGAFDADFHAGELRKHGMRLKLARRPFQVLQVLQVLLEHPQEVVTREELRRRLWPENVFVEHEVALKKAINRIREALGDSAESPRFIETISRVGYRFICELEEVTRTNEVRIPANAGVAADELRERGRKFSTGFVVAGAVAVVLATLIGAKLTGMRNILAGNTSPRIQSIAVLPLTSLSGDPAQEYFADGLTDALIGDLSQISALKVISRTSVMRYKKTDKSLPQIARELDVDAVIEGTVQRSGGRTRITAQLIQGATDKHLWASSYDRSLEDALPLQGEIANEIAEEIRVKVTPQERLRMTQSRQLNLEAVEAYLQGRYHYQNAMDMGAHRGAAKLREPELKLAVSYFNRAIADDPNYAPAYVGLGESLGVPATFPYPPRSFAPSAKDALNKALTIDPTLAQAHVDLGKIEFREWNWKTAEQEFKRAIELNPNLASARISYTDYLRAMGRLDEALEQAERAKALEPGNDQVAWQFYCRHQFDRFIEMKRGDIARHAFGGMAHYDLGHGYERAHMFEKAIEEWEQAMRIWGYDDLAEDLRKGYGAGGFKGALRAWAAGLETLYKQGEVVHPDLMAYLYENLGDKDRAFAWLEKSIEMHSSGSLYFKVDPDVDDLRSDPRFAELMRRMDLTL